MIMVRRRARPAKEPALMVVTSNVVDSPPLSAVAAAAAAPPLLEDQYFASPKRKDCRLMKANENLNNCNSNNNNNNSKTTTAITKPETGRTIGKFILVLFHILRLTYSTSPLPFAIPHHISCLGVPLATRSQTRTIENFFRANAAAKKMTTTTAVTTITNEDQKTITIEEEVEDEDEEAAEEEEEALLYDAQSIASPSTSHSSAAYQNDEDLETDSAHTHTDTALDSALHTDATALHTNTATQTDDATLSTVAFQTHRSALRDSHSSSHSSSSSSRSDNIFLQEPVLTLDIDRTPTKASSIRINKSFELANAVFSSPPSVLSACVLNGRFNQIVSLNGQELEQEHQQQQHQLVQVQQQQQLELDQHDSSSCDSGVACSLVMPTTGDSSPAGTRRRKPATPHRILCPSPIKVMPKVGEVVTSPRKSPRKLQLQLAATSGCKSRRRLNQPKPQAPYQHQHQHQKQQQQLEPSSITNSPPSSIMMANEDVVVLLHDDDEDDDIGVEEDGDDGDDVHALLKAAEERENQRNKATKAPMVANKPTAVTVPKATTLAKPKAKGRTTASKSQPLAATNGNREMTDFFPVRRSVRKTKTAVKEEMMRNLEQAVLEERCEGLQVRHFMGKGRGVVAERHFKRNEFVVEYVGDLIAISEATERERRYALDENAGCYMYYFKHKNQQYCIDATVDTGKLGRLINHSRNGNLMTKVVVIKQRPHLVLLAKDDIEPGEELTYDYGDRSKESLLHHPWLAF